MPIHLSLRPIEPNSPEIEQFDPQRFAECIGNVETQFGITPSRELLSRIHSLNGTRVRIALRQDLNERVHDLLKGTVPHLEAQLFNLNVPLSPEKRALFNLADDLLAALITSYKIQLKDQSRRLFGLASSGRAVLPVQRMMSLISRRICLSYRAYSSAPKGAWHELHDLHNFATRRGVAARVLNESSQSPASIYKRALLLAFSDPLRFTSDDLEFALELIDRHADRAEFTPAKAAGEIEPAFLIKPHRDQAGSAYSSSQAVNLHPSDFLLNVGEVAKALLQGATEGRVDAQDLNSPASIGRSRRDAIVALLARQWAAAAAPSRQLNRLKTQAHVGIQIGLSEIWAFLNKTTGVENSSARWLVTNESPRGFALTHASGPVAQVRVGEVVGVFAPNNPGCHICVVRWTLSDNPAHIEIGLQEIAPSARAANVRRMTTESPAEPALLLTDASASQNDPIVVTSVTKLDSMCELTVGELDAKVRLQPNRIVERMATTQLVQFSSVS
ncbi:MAG: hypothetical protein ACKVQU_05115 [Burkholderiales bacterium]